MNIIKVNMLHRLAQHCRIRATRTINQIDQTVCRMQDFLGSNNSAECGYLEICKDLTVMPELD